ncbi:MAG: hypothetical protein WA708_05390 [Acidobacteriaceae bacterium]
MRDLAAGPVQTGLVNQSLNHPERPSNPGGAVPVHAKSGWRMTGGCALRTRPAPQMCQRRKASQPYPADSASHSEHFQRNDGLRSANPHDRKTTPKGCLYLCRVDCCLSLTHFRNQNDKKTLVLFTKLEESDFREPRRVVGKPLKNKPLPARRQLAGERQDLT